jgi:phage terminase large subunit GpA-like protein
MPRKTRTSIAGYKDLGDVICQTVEQVWQDPDNKSPSEWAEEERYLNNAPGYVGPWRFSMAPYLREPLDQTTNPDLDAVIFVGPAQCGKTELILNWAGYSIRSDPSDMTIFSPTQNNARDFSNRRIDRLFRDSEKVGKELLDSRDADNKYDKHFKNGSILGLAWPTKAELAGKPIPRIALTDRDRMDDNIEEEGDPFDLATKRTTSYGSFAMTLCESSPSREITDYRYVLKTPHEAPPTTGILSLYNRGDRRRWYIPCARCGEFFEPRFELLRYDENLTTLDAAESCYLECPTCDGHIDPDERFGLMQNGLWLPDGCHIEKGEVAGNARRTKYASYWLEGCSAAFTNWPKLVAAYLTAEEAFESTMNEEPLRKFYNTDLGRPYKLKAAAAERTPEDLIARAEDFGRNEKNEIEIISEIAFLLATVDVQKNMFIVQIWGIVPGTPYDLVLVERFDIRKSKRVDADGDVLWVKPGTYLDDWDLVEEQVVRRQYPIQGRPGKRMGIRMTGCDSGGKAGVTPNAYNFWRKMSKKGLGKRFVLLKGTGTPTAPHIRESFPDASDRKNMAAARGDVPVFMLNSNLLKNEANNRLESVEKGKGMVRIPSWNDSWLFSEFCSEVSGDKGWVKLAGKRNEAWDLLYYAIGLCMSKYIKCERPTFWETPPSWANQFDATNPFIVDAGSELFAEPVKSSYDLAEMASQIA